TCRRSNKSPATAMAALFYSTAALLALADATCYAYHTHERCMLMRTNIVLNERLVSEAFKFADVKTKKDLIDLALREFVQQRKRADIRELRGKGLMNPSYDYRAARRGK
ncbi:MAG TPA: type II toxin-antitoxin system VapB family antitoxin, partial [Anaerolineae bacterium]